MIGPNTPSAKQLADTLAPYGSRVNLVIADCFRNGLQETVARHDFVKTRQLDPRFDFSHQVGNHHTALSCTFNGNGIEASHPFGSKLYNLYCCRYSLPNSAFSFAGIWSRQVSCCPSASDSFQPAVCSTCDAAKQEAALQGWCSISRLAGLGHTTLSSLHLAGGL